MIRTNVIKVLTQYNMSVRELKLKIAHREYNKALLKNAHDLECKLSTEVYLGNIRIWKPIQC